MLATKNKNSGIYILLFFWLIINLVQAYFTELSHDESYYWMFSQHLDWGYYDHPPMVALFIKIGYSLFQNELGVRLLIVLASTLSVFLIYKMLNKGQEDIILFASLCLGMCMFNASGFLAVPDIPLILFTALFFVGYKNYLDKKSIYSEAFLALTIALLMYSKYHGILVIFFVILSNPKLLTTGSFWRVTAISILLFTPHIIWQILHDYPSVKYHLIYRSNAPYQFKFTWDYLLGQLIVTGPLIGLVVLWAAFTGKTNGDFEKALKWTAVGIFSFFFITSFKGWVEANWTIPAFIPLIVLAHQNLYKSHHRKWILYLFIPTIIFIAAARILLMTNVPLNMNIETQFHGWKDWAKNIDQIAEGRPVVFENSYQLASKYTFYSGKIGHSYNAFSYRSNMYNIWDIEDKIQGKEVKIIFNYPLNESDSLALKNKTVFIKKQNNFRSYNKLWIEPEHKSIETSLDSVSISVEIRNNFIFPVLFQETQPAYVHTLIHQNNKMVLNGAHVIIPDQEVLPGDFFVMEIKTALPKKPGNYDIRFGISCDDLPPGFNSGFLKLVIY
ncbi:MAG: ArnT family glycosyltransferase [Cytophagaceae bacterium]